MLKVSTDSSHELGPTIDDRMIVIFDLDTQILIFYEQASFKYGNDKLALKTHFPI